MPTDLSKLDFIPPGHASAGASFFVSFVLLGLGGLFALISMIVRARTLRAAQARENELHGQKSGPLSAGPERVVRGKVEVEGDEVAVDVTITQRATNHTSKNSKSHTWTEVERSVKSRPFTLVTDAGEAVLVEPGEQVLVADGLETEHPPGKTMNRLRRCDVKRGETFTAYGDLHRVGEGGGGGAYRSAQSGWVLRPSRRSGSMLLATETIKERYVQRMQTLTTWSVVLSIVWIIFHVIVTMPFTVSAFWGKPTQALVTNTSTYVTKHKNSRTTHYVVEAVTSDGRNLKDEVERSTYSRIETIRTAEKRDALIPAFVGPVGFPDYLGVEAHLSGGMLAAAAGVWLVALLVAFSHYASKTAWYDLKKVHEPGGSGHWPPS
ncbi:MAG: hypothetical protein U0174_13365 [Polyangiaceae bacterium]